MRFSWQWDKRDNRIFPTSGFFVTASADQTARIWDAETGAELRRLHGDNEILRRAMDADDARLRTAEERVYGGMTWGCDAPEHMADEILSLRVERDALARELDECKRVLAYAAEEAERLNHKHIGTEHLMLGLLREEKCFAAEILHAVREEMAGTLADLVLSSISPISPKISPGPRMLRITSLPSASPIITLSRPVTTM